MNILEEFWYGNLDPAEYDANPSKEYKELVRLISRNEEKLLTTMTDEQKDLFSRYTDCVREHQAMAECLLFQNSFRLGGRMMFNMLEAHEKHRRVLNIKRGCRNLQPLCYVVYLSSALASASWKSLVSVKISFL